MYNIRNSAGQTLINLIIVMGLLAVLATAFAQLSIQGIKNEKNVESLFEANNLQNVVMLALQNSTVCSGNLNTTNFVTLTFDTTASTLFNNVININQLTYPNGNQMAKLNMVFGTAYLQITKIYMTYFIELVQGSSYMASLRFEFTKPKNYATGAQKFERDMPIILSTAYTVNPIVKMTGCYTGGGGGGGGTSSTSAPTPVPGSLVGYCYADDYGDGCMGATAPAYCGAATSTFGPGAGVGYTYGCSCPAGYSIVQTGYQWSTSAGAGYYFFSCLKN